MAYVEIEGIQKDLNGKYEQWLAEQIGNRNDKGVAVSVRVVIDELSLSFIAESCPRSGGGSGSRTYSPKQKEVIQLWTDMGLCDSDFGLGNLISFLKRLRKFL